ncbi:MAG: hypothetical protein AAB403_15680 [Planctomycetota bacterium]
MAFPIPGGLRVIYEARADSDAQVAAVEGAQPPGTRMLVAVGFAFKWPGFGVSADLADAAVRRLAGLQPWPEHGRVVIADPDGEAVWWVAYQSSPAWWVPILAAMAVLIALAITFRIVRVVAPEVAAPVETILNIAPLLVMVLLFSLLPQVSGMLRGGLGPERLKGG